MSHDEHYKSLFTHWPIFAALVEAFLPKALCDVIDLDTLEAYSGEFTSDTAPPKVRRSDMIWRVKRRGQWLYLYLMVEFQSKNDPRMALRMEQYKTLLWKHLVDTEKHRGKLPPIVPIVLYMPETPWSAPLRLSELVVPLPPEVLPEGQSYILLEQRLLSGNADDNIAAALFALARERDLTQISTHIHALEKLLRSPDARRSHDAVLEWIKKYSLMSDFDSLTIEHIESLTEAQQMLDRNAQYMRETLREEGLEEGRVEGLEQGLEEGLERGLEEGLEKGLEKSRLEMVAFCLDQLIQRFGTIDTVNEHRVRQATSQQLMRWNSQVSQSESIQEALREQ